MKIGWILAAALIVAGAMATPALAANAKLKQLLDDGFTIVSAEVVSQETLRRAMGNDNWVDDYLVTLQKGNQMAICHAALLLASAAENLMDIDCSVAGGDIAPAPAQPRLPRPPQ